MSQRTIIDIHVLQTVPPSNLNRDDTGSPKTAMYGGVRRARVSSQAWKRATRTAFNDRVDPSKLGVRTRRVVELVTDELHSQDPTLSPEAATELAEGALGAAGIKLKAARKKDAPQESGYLLFLSRRQVQNLARAAIAARSAEEPKQTMSKAEARKIVDQEHSIDVSLFGRMVADDTALNVDASAQVAHALSVHAVENEFDYFTAVDDHKSNDEDEDAGAGMIGTVEFNSATLYRYATVDVDRLHDNLGDTAATRVAVAEFLNAFVTSMPTGKQNTFANRTLPDVVLVTVWDRQSVSYVGAFEEAIVASEGRGRLRTATERLSTYAAEIGASFGLEPVANYVVGVGAAREGLDDFGDPIPFPALVEAVEEQVRQRLAEAVPSAPAPTTEAP